MFSVEVYRVSRRRRPQVHGEEVGARSQQRLLRSGAAVLAFRQFRDMCCIPHNMAYTLMTPHKIL